MAKKPEYMWHGRDEGDGIELGWTSGPGASRLSFIQTSVTHVPDYSHLMPASLMKSNESAMDLQPWNYEFEIAESNMEKCSSDPVVAAATAKLILGVSNDPFCFIRVTHRLVTF